MFEVQGRSPVVGEVISHLARGAGSPRANVARHGRVERISTNDVVNMSGGQRAWLASRIKALEGQSGTWKAKPSLNGGDECESRREGLHLGDGDVSKVLAIKSWKL